MSTPIDDSFYPSDMDEYTLHHYTDDSGDVDPRLLSSPQNTAIMGHESSREAFSQHNHLLSSDYNIFPNVAPHQLYFDPEMSMPSYEPMRHQMLGHRRSVSVPPEDLMPESIQPPPGPPAMVFHRGGTPLGDSMGRAKGGSGSKKWLKRAAAAQKRQMQRHTPYPIAGSGRTFDVERTAHTQQLPSNQGPTSAPQQQYQQPNYPREEDISQAIMQHFDTTSPAHPSPHFNNFDTANLDTGYRTSPAQLPMQITDIDALALGSRSTIDTAVFGMLGLTERLSRDCVAMREFLSRGFKPIDEDEVESLRQKKRAHNHKLLSLDDELAILPLTAEQNEIDINVPLTPQEIKDLDVDNTNALLESYAIVYTPDMFLHEKKLAYLRFVGVCRGLMHLVLD